MPKETYHHGDLRNALIEAGITYINDYGAAQFSLRRISEMCGVSHAAAYSHFKDKDSLLVAMKGHVTEAFVQQLDDVVLCCAGQPDILHELGKAYLRFFLASPSFFGLLFGHMEVAIDLNDAGAESYRPFDIFKGQAIALMEQEGIPEGSWMQNIAAMWAMVHGVTALAVTGSARQGEDLCRLLDRMMAENFKFAIHQNGDR